MSQPDVHDIPSLLKQIDNAEGNDKELHKLYNNLGVAYTSARIFDKALDAHRNEKIACEALLEAAPDDVERLVDVAIAYRQCGNATSRCSKLKLKGTEVTYEKRLILASANDQHQKALGNAVEAVERDRESLAAMRELQSATNSVGQTAVEIALINNDTNMLQVACATSALAVKLARNLPRACRHQDKRSRSFGAAINYALGLGGLGQRDLAQKMLQAVAVHANKADDDVNFMRAAANLVDINIDLSDFERAKEFAEMWAERASSVGNSHEEATALIKLGDVLTKLHQHAAARDTLQRALLLDADDVTRSQIEEGLEVVENNLEKDAKEAETLKNCEDQLCQDGIEPAEEALLRREAGNYAFALRRYNKCMEHLERYMELVDNHKHECNPTKLGLHKQEHARTVANLAEACWMAKHSEQAVKWGGRELLAYGDEKAGQAQAWNNLGNYLADNGDKQKGIEALRKSIAIAKECGELKLLKQAQENLDIELENMKEDPTVHAPAEDEGQDVVMLEQDPLPDNMEQVLPLISSNLKNSQSQRTDSDLNLPKSTRSRSPQPQERCGSIVLCSGQNLNIPGQVSAEFSVARSRNVGGGATSSGAFSVSRPLVAGTRSIGAKFGSGVQSSATTRYKDVAELYKKLCGSGKSKSADAPRPREGVLSVLREVAAAAMLETDDSKSVLVDMSEQFLTDAELSILIRSLVALSVDRTVELSLARNRLLTARGYSTFFDKQLPRSVVSLDLTASGADAACIRALVRASDDGALSNMVSVNLSKNAIGRSAQDAADACADLVDCGGLVTLDLSFNLLPPAFLVRFVQRLKTVRNRRRPRRLAFLDLKLNNARNPAALLEFPKPSDVVQCLVGLSNAVNTIMEIDIRACGGRREVRRAIHDARATTGHLNVMVVSEGKVDPALT